VFPLQENFAPVHVRPSAKESVRGQSRCRGGSAIRGAQKRPPVRSVRAFAYRTVTADLRVDERGLWPFSDQESILKMLKTDAIAMTASDRFPVKRAAVPVCR